MDYLFKPEMAFFVFILGLIIGSFLNVLIDRMPRGEKITGRSYCESCDKTLGWIDLIPIFSYVRTKGKCRYCRVNLSLQYPLIEITTGTFFVLVFLLFPFPNLIYFLFLISILIIIFMIDLKFGIILDKIIFPSIFITFLYLFFSGENIVIHFISALGSFLFFYFLYFITKKRGMGFGDVKFAFLIGLIFGFPETFYVLYVAFLTGALIGTILILWKKKKLKNSVPFGPFLVIGCLIVLFFQNQIQVLVNHLF